MHRSAGGRQNHKGPDMGHGGPGALQGDHVGVLPRRSGRAAGVRHCQAPVLRECGAVATRAARPRRPEHTDHARWQQKRSQAPQVGTAATQFT